MAHYSTDLVWTRGDQPFLDKRYSRRHLIRLDGGVEIPASSSPHVVRVPMSDPAALDPEEGFVASLSSCHMLWFLDFAARAGFRVDRYADHATGVLAKNAAGREAMTEVTLHPDVAFSGERRPTREEITHLHHQAHDACYIANSVTTDVRVEPEFGEAR
ncbi:MAG: OsmC family protein [Gemmatimonadetes bacterium]|nr:OsmC family protein [Gemmatimonadota bacterium]